MTTNQREIIARVGSEVRRKFDSDTTGHDWFHIERVQKMARRIAREEHANMFVVELGALLHDIADWKMHGNDESVGPRHARKLLRKHGVSKEVTDHVVDIVATVSYKGAGVKTPMKTLEGKVVQDADRLDAMGAIGIARAFVFGAHLKRPLYDPTVKPVLHRSKKEYGKRQGTSINHLYEKSLLLAKRLNTATARRIARDRDRFTRQYLKQFHAEWRGRK